MKKLSTLILLMLALYTACMSQTCDTLFNLKSNMDTPTLYAADTGISAGYLSGNNVYGDSIKAEGFASPTGDSLTEAYFYFAICTINSSDSNNNIKFYIWDNTGTDATTGNPGAPGNALDSTTLTLKQIAEAVTDSEWIEVYFTGSKILTDTFYVGVVLPTTTGDTLALWTDSQYGVGGDGWEYAPGYGGWSTYTDLNPSYYNLGNYIKSYVCGPNPAGIIARANTQHINVYPNPTEDIITIAFDGIVTTENYALFDLLGNQVLAGNLVNSVTQLNLNSLAAGAYFLKLNEGQGQAQTFKIIKAR